MKKIFILSLGLCLGFIGCKDNSKNNPEEDVVIVEDEVLTLEDSLSWNGTYQGLVPCASCPGILTTVRLGKDKTFEKTEFYLESEDGYFKRKGNFMFSPDGGKITLTSDKDTLVYLFDENHSDQLNREQKEIAAELADQYVLTKLSEANVQFTDDPVKGMLIIENETSSFQPIGSSKVFLIKDLENGLLAKKYEEKTNKKHPMPVLAELVLKNREASNEDMENNYDGVLNLVEVKSIERITPENYNVK